MALSPCTSSATTNAISRTPDPMRQPMISAEPHPLLLPLISA